MTLSWWGLFLLVVSVGGLNVVVLVQEDVPLQDAMQSVVTLASQHTSEGAAAAAGDAIDVDVVTTTQGLAAVQDLCLALDRADGAAVAVRGKERERLRATGRSAYETLKKVSKPHREVEAFRTPKLSLNSTVKAPRYEQARPSNPINPRGSSSTRLPPGTPPQFSSLDGITLFFFIGGERCTYRVKWGAARCRSPYPRARVLTSLFFKDRLCSGKCRAFDRCFTAVVLFCSPRLSLRDRPPQLGRAQHSIIRAFGQIVQHQRTQNNGWLCRG